MNASIPALAMSDDCTAHRARRRDKDASIETLRGFIVLLLVGYHALGSLQIDDSSALASCLHQQFRLIVDSFMMPVFAAVAGFVYAMRSSAGQHMGALVAGKCKRLLLPFAFAVTLTHLFRSLAPGISHRTELSAIWQAYAFPPEQFWFIQSLFWIFLIVIMLGRWAVLSRLRYLLACTGVGIVALLVIPGPEFLSIWGVLYLFPFFLAGLGLARWPSLLRSRGLVWVSMFSALAGLFGLELAFRRSLNMDATRTGLLAVGFGFAMSYLLLRFRRPILPLATLGTFSYAIYLYHGFGLALARRISHTGDGGSAQLSFLLGCTCGVLFPVIIQMIVRRMPVLPLVMFGERSAWPWHRAEPGIQTRVPSGSSDGRPVATSVAEAPSAAT